MAGILGYAHGPQGVLGDGPEPAHGVLGGQVRVYRPDLIDPRGGGVFLAPPAGGAMFVPPAVAGHAVSSIPGAIEQMAGQVQQFDDALWGREPMSANDQFMLAQGLSGVATTGGIATAGMRPGVGIFGGRLARTADQTALARAEKMAADGADKTAIWNETGWFQGKDGKWRFEIPDDKTKWVIPPRDWVTENEAGVLMAPMVGEAFHRARANLVPEAPVRVKRLLDHEALGAAYPDAPETKVMLQKEGRGALYTLKDGSQVIGVHEHSQPDVARGTILHELQHRVQDTEGTAQGGSPTLGHARDDVWAAAKSAYEDAAGDDDILRELGVAVPERPAPRKSWDELSDRQKLEWLERGRERLYYRLAGEVEARNVQTRKDLTPEQRRATPPWLTQDVPDADQIVRMGGQGGVSMSAPNAKMMTPMSIDDFSQRWKERGITSSVSDIPSRNQYEIGKVVVPKDQRSKGLGTAFMEELIQAADANGRTITLSPSVDFGGSSVGRLKEFYKRFGFVENKGRHYDPAISNSMYRLPRDATRYTDGEVY